MIQKVKYLIHEAFRTIRRHKGVTSISITIMSLSLLMLAVFLLATDNLLKFIGEAQREMKVYVYLDDSLEQARIERCYRDLLAMGEVETVVFVSKNEALLDFRKQLGEDTDLVDALEANPLPNSFWVAVKHEHKTRESLEGLSARIAAISGVEEVRYGKEFVDKFSRVVRGIYYIDIVVGFIVILSAVFIISNAVRLTILSRRKNIEILKLVGATNRFISAPFIIEGAFQGGIAAVFSLILLFGVTLVSRQIVPELSFFSFEKTVVFTVTCVAIGSLGSFTALRRFLRL